MLHGPPGTGKTLLVKALAKEAAACVLQVSAADFMGNLVGDDEKLVRAVFSLAKKLDPCVIFIDEADSVFRKRRPDDKEWFRSLISQFLQEWDGVTSSNKGGLVIAATNRPGDLDPAFLRRLPRSILVDSPSDQARAKILGIHLKDEKLADEVDLEEIARQAASLTGSDLKNLCVVAAMAAVYETHAEILEGSDGKSWTKLKSKVKRNKDKNSKASGRRVIYDRHFQQALSEISGAIEVPEISKIRNFGQMYKENV